jgi:hypothetical protein
VDRTNNYLPNGFANSKNGWFYTNPTSGFPFPEATEERARELLSQEN